MTWFIDGSSQALHSFAVAHPWLTPVVVWVTAGFIVLCPVGFFLLWVWDRRLRPGVAALVGLGLTQWACHETGKLTYRPRPLVAMHFTPPFPHVPDSSCPSGCPAVGAVAGVIGGLAWRRVGLLFVVGTGAVGFGCVCVGVPYGSD